VPTLRFWHEDFRRGFRVQTQITCVLQIVGVNEVNEEVVPFSGAHQILREQDMKGNPLTHLITERSAAALGGLCLSLCLSGCLHVFRDFCLPGHRTQTPIYTMCMSVCLSACIWGLLLELQNSGTPSCTSSLKGQQGLWGVCASKCVCLPACLSACIWGLLLKLTT